MTQDPALAPGARRVRHDVVVTHGKTKIRIVHGAEVPDLIARVVGLLEELPLPASPERRRASRAGVTVIDSQRDQSPVREGDISEFLAVRCQIKFQSWVRAATLTRAYFAWCAAENLRPVSKIALRRALGQQFRPGRSRRLQGKQLRSWEGVGLLEGGAA